MNRSNIPLVELAAGPRGLVIAAMSASFSHTEEADTVSDAHRHDYYSLFYLETGRLDFEIDTQLIHMTSGALLILHPEQVHQSVHSADISGWVMSFDGKFAPDLQKEKTPGHIEHYVKEIATITE